jgi:hypothetical protein
VADAGADQGTHGRQRRHPHGGENRRDRGVGTSVDNFKIRADRQAAISIPQYR